MTTLPVTAGVDSATPGQVDFACRWKGATGNDINPHLQLWRDIRRRGPADRPRADDHRDVRRRRRAGYDGSHRCHRVQAVPARPRCLTTTPGRSTLGMPSTAFAAGGRWALCAANSTAGSSTRSASTTPISSNGVWPHNSAVDLEPGHRAGDAVADLGGGGGLTVRRVPGALLVDPAAPLQTLELVGNPPGAARRAFPRPVELNDLVNSGIAVQGVDKRWRAGDPPRGDAVPAQCLRPVRHRVRADDDLVELGRAADPHAIDNHHEVSRARSWPRIRPATASAPALGRTSLRRPIIMSELVAEAVSAIYDGP